MWACVFTGRSSGNSRWGRAGHQVSPYLPGHGIWEISYTLSQSPVNWSRNKLFQGYSRPVPPFLQTLLLKLWPTDQNHGYHFRACENAESWAPPQTCWIGIIILTQTSDNSYIVTLRFKEHYLGSLWDKLGSFKVGITPSNRVVKEAKILHLL